MITGMLCWGQFFLERAPILRSQFLTALMSGAPLVMERLPDVVLLDAVRLRVQWAKAQRLLSGGCKHCGGAGTVAKLQGRGAAG